MALEGFRKKNFIIKDTYSYCWERQSLVHSLSTRLNHMKMSLRPGTLPYQEIKHHLHYGAWFIILYGNIFLCFKHSEYSFVSASSVCSIWYLTNSTVMGCPLMEGNRLSFIAAREYNIVPSRVSLHCVFLGNSDAQMQ